MARLAAAVAANQARHGLPCSVATLIESVKVKADRAELEAAIKNRSIGHSVLARAIKDVHKVQLPPNALMRHRNGECRCSRG